MEYQRAMSGSEISRSLGITRQAVSQALKRAMKKVYVGLQEQNITENPTETVLFMREWFGITDEEDIEQFFDLFPSEIQEEIRAHARSYSIENY
jgi:DNA-binding transcriptional regulator LsrR (DeoR family)